MNCSKEPFRGNESDQLNTKRRAESVRVCACVCVCVSEDGERYPDSKVMMS